ncbi:MAG: hypothetical protein JO202_12065 [Ktedonobacteraceae bacterium]|nr:hypothetical protein [Ktedonobacteraceae bacterium]
MSAITCDPVRDEDSEQCICPQHPDARPLRRERSSGKVFLIGADTHDSELSTFTGQRCLCAADVVIYDRLISRELLREASPRAVLMYVGKESGQHTAQQEQINALVVEYARQGYLVVRLKDGDPFVFGRGGEEALALAKAGIAFEIVARAGSA